MLRELFKMLKELFKMLRELFKMLKELFKMLKELSKMLKELFKMLREDLFFPWAMLNAASPLFYPRQTDSPKLRCVCPD